jgi:hypothetical protein
MNISQAGKRVVLRAAIVVWIVGSVAIVAANGRSETVDQPTPAAVTARIEYLEGVVLIFGGAA